MRAKDFIPPPFPPPAAPQSIDRTGPELPQAQCPSGEVPVSKDANSYFPKGNPSLLFESPPVGPSACDGIFYFGACYYYAGAYVYRFGNGAGTTLSVERPAYFSPRRGHSLVEIALQGGQGYGNIIELGWNVSGQQYSDVDPHLFVFHWINNRPTCYNGCGWRQYSSVYFPGMNLSDQVGASIWTGYLQMNGDWWAWLNDEWLGYFPGSEWGGQYTQNELTQWFGEIATLGGIPPMHAMGNGRFPSDPDAAAMLNLCTMMGGDFVCGVQGYRSTVAAYYDIAATEPDRARYGGPGQ